MKITKEKDQIIIRIPFWQSSYDAVGQKIGNIPNVIGLIEKDTCTINQLIDMAYKGKAPQVGGTLIETDLLPDEFKKLCVELGIDYEELPVCFYCFKPIWGAFTIDKKGRDMCLDCKEKN